MTRRRTAATAIAALVLAVTAACGSTEPTAKPLGAAEPATSPPLSATPAGTVVQVADRPQGIAYDPRTHLLAVAVHDQLRLLILDPTTLALVHAVPLPGKARHIIDAADGGPIIVPDEAANELIEVFLPSFRTRITKVGLHPHNGIGVPNGDILVGNEFSHSISKVRDGRVLMTKPGVEQPGGLAVYRDIVAAVDVHAFAVETFDLRTLDRTHVLKVGTGPTHGVSTTGGRMVVTDTRGGVIYTVGLDPLKILGSYRVPGGSPYGIAEDPRTGQVWVTLVATNKLLGFDMSGDTPRKIAEYDTVRQPDTVAVAPGGHTIWVTGTHDGVIQRITR